LETPGHLIVDVARLDEAGESFSGETAAGLLELDADPLCTPEGGIVYQILVEQIGGELLARGRVSHRFQCKCSRCADVFALEVVEPSFFADYSVAEGTEYVDLTPEMREAIIISLPGYPVCREGCKGLCARCGANLNRETCACGPAPDGSWAALDQLVRR
jgi:uncharacterized metal-binding protein YceD (DUF177 family)